MSSVVLPPTLIVLPSYALPLGPSYEGAQLKFLLHTLGNPLDLSITLDYRSLPDLSLVNALDMPTMLQNSILGFLEIKGKYSGKGHSTQAEAEAKPSRSIPSSLHNIVYTFEFYRVSSMVITGNEKGYEKEG
ncbi:hypothetical protein EDB19DRAFT_1910393 [Suillus lakei]|nr:hypothetical protein EDB19DRAFT_1910393 [Suillus lakei]